MLKKNSSQDFRELKDIYKVSTIQKILSFYNKKISKQLGQHYLIDLNIVNKIIDTVFHPTQKVVVEIGSGIGVLTEQFLKKKISVYSIEIEKKSIEILKKIFASYLIIEEINFKQKEDFLKKEKLDSDKTFLFLERNDILKSDLLRKTIQEKTQQKLIQQIFSLPLTIVGNLPYQVSSRIIIDIGENLGKSFFCFQCCFMIQKEVSDKIKSKVGDKNYCKLSVLCHYFFEVLGYFPVSPNCFYPPPKVISEVIHLKPRIEKITQEYFFFKKIVILGFQHRRKKIFKNISNSFKINSNTLQEIFNNLKIPLHSRAENLSWQNFLSLSKKIKKINLTVH